METIKKIGNIHVISVPRMLLDWLIPDRVQVPAADEDLIRASMGAKALRLGRYKPRSLYVAHLEDNIIFQAGVMNGIFYGGGAVGLLWLWTTLAG